MNSFAGLFATFTTILTGFVAISAQAESPIPSGATVLETHAVATNRKLILWMLNPTKHPSEYTSDDPYTCPDETRGSYYSGELHVSLVNSKTNKVINVIKVESNDPNTDIDIPYKIRRGPYYRVLNGNRNTERKPTILTLKDYNGDGKAQEFALFDAEACMGLGTTLIGYSKKEDKVKQFPIVVKTGEGMTTQYWLDYLFWVKPTKPGFWKYQIDYRGRGGTLDRHTVRYSSRSETFYATITSQQ